MSIDFEPYIFLVTLLPDSDTHHQSVSGYYMVSVRLQRAFLPVMAIPASKDMIVSRRQDP